ncbi:alanine-phosphoribitol ligase [Variovorax sp. WS11]|uniref:styrene monooxygenase/indole monooxygenase family protein n=1 Tax=Variovorax sp. WS11 TaxID=1105204 RepID=UPI000D0CE7BE|nr:styrene monooxygenase/indole monooxygenase family protein [Variovorax sp. WS11]NDZ16244.1 FAD-dependent oxidoreductase [Variovorax sp. WS11]PSL83886.1 alanine-phosphoribitol ligase [Variovorax sp. WS11]
MSIVSPAAAARRIMIVGAGQAGLQLALGLQQQGLQVTLVSNRSAEDIRTGKVMSSQCMFDASLQIERDLGIDFWERECPPVEGIGLSIPHPERPGEKMLAWAHRLDRVARSVDQRVKIPGWMKVFAERGGEILFKEATVEDLEQWTQAHELVIVAAGKGEIAQLFERDADKSPFDKPQRALALTYVHDMRPRPAYSAVDFNLIPGVGEYFVFPALTITGPCDIMVFEGVPGGPMDCWAGIGTPAEHLARSLKILETFAPWEAERCRDVRLTDDNGILAGRFAPTVRRPVGRLPSGRIVLGMGDVVCLNDPITGQGSNNAAKCAHAYQRAILAQGTRAFDAAFMQAAFDGYWEYAQHVVNWTNAMLQPPPPHVLELLGAASAMPAVARRIVNGFDDPRDYANFFMAPDKASAYLRAETQPEAA